MNTDKDTGFGTAQLPVKVHTFIPAVSDLPPIFPDNRPGSPYIAPNVDAPFHSTVFNSPEILGGGKSLMIGSLIQQQFGAARNWPFGAALAFVLLALVLLALMAHALRYRVLR